MKLKFKKQSNQAIIKSLEDAMAGRNLKDLISLEDQDNCLVVKISKLGTSTLTFSRTDHGEDAQFILSSEKIAFAHKAFKNDVTDKLIHIIKKAGGEVIEA
jgi:hypothetical protein